MKKIFIKRNEIFKYLIYYVLILTFTFAKTSGGLMPFGLPLFSSLVFAEVNVIYIFPVYFIANMLKDMSWMNVIISVTPLFLFISTYFLYHKLKRRISITTIIIVTLLAEIPYVVFEFLWGNIYKCVIEVLISLVCAYIFSISTHAIIFRGLKFRLSLDEKISSLILLGVVALSLYSIEIDGVNLLYPIFVLGVVFSGCTLSGSAPLIFAVTAGLGACFSGGGTDVFTICVLLGIVEMMFQNLPPYFSAIGIAVTFTLGTLYFKYVNYWYVNVVNVVFVLLVYVLIPKKYKLKNVFSNIDTSGVGKSVINKNRREIAEKLYSLSSVFEDMGECLIINGNDNKISDAEIANSVSRDYCEKCENSSACFSQLGSDTTEILTSVVCSSIRHKKCSIIDMPPFITSRCKRLNGLIQEVNNKISSAKIYENAKDSAINSQNMLAVEMSGIADIFEKLGDDYKKSLSFDTNRERRILDELSFHGVNAKEVLVYGEKQDIFVSIIVRKEHAEKKIIKDILSVILKVKLSIVSHDDFSDDYVSLTLSPTPKFDVVYYVANATRNGEELSGDVTIVKKFRSNKMLFAISDGMGSGDSAESIASKTAKTVENFYMAGFSPNVVASVTNRMLMLKENEDYSAVDIMTLDLNTGMALFIKCGGVYSLIKRNDDIEVVEGHALPLGIIKDARPYQEKRMLAQGDIIIMFSDGITDVLGVADIVNEIGDKINIEVLANDILNLAKLRGAKDDATVMCAKIFIS